MFKEHGTKIIGGVVTVVGTIAGLDPNLIGSIFGPRAAGIVMAAGGLWTILRGFQNSGTLPGGPAAAQKPKE